MLVMVLYRVGDLLCDAVLCCVVLCCGALRTVDRPRGEGGKRWCK